MAAAAELHDAMQGILDCNTFTLPKEQLAKLDGLPQNPTAFEPERAYSTQMT